MVLRHLVQTRQDKNDIGKLDPPPKAMPQIDTVCDNPPWQEQNERPVATRQNQTRIRPPTTTASFCVPDSDTSIVVPYSAAPMCQLADALRFGHVGACLPCLLYTSPSPRDS